MKVKVLRGYLGKEGRVHSGDRLDISEPRFRQLTEGRNEKNPLVAATEVGYKMQERHQNKMEPDPKNKQRLVNLQGQRVLTADQLRKLEEIHLTNPKDAHKLESRTFIKEEVAKTAPADPTPSPQAGGPTGAASAASSSEPAPQRAKRKYTKRVVEPESWPSIDRGNWRPGQTSSTAVTSRGGKNTRASRTSKE